MGFRREGLAETAALFLKMGCLAFGGPSAHIAMLEDEVVTRRGWLDRQHFLDLVGATHLIPGPNSTEMMLHVGYERHGLLGLAVAGALFVLPATILTGLCAWAYVSYGTLPQVAPLFYGMKPAILALILLAVWRLGRGAVRDWRHAVVGLAVALAVLSGTDEIVTMFAGGILGALALRATDSWRGRRGGAPPAVAALAAGAVAEASAAAPRALAPGLGSASAGGLAAGAVVVSGGASPAAGVSLVTLALFFLKVGAILYGSGYVLVAFLEGGLVGELGWLSREQLLDAVAIGQFTPGPVLSTATFVGYLVAGTAGAGVATAAIFLPSFVFVLILNPWVPKLRGNAWSAAFLDAVNVTAVGLMVAVMIELASVTLTGWLAWAIALASAVAVLRFRIHAAWLVPAGALVGYAIWLVSGG